MIGKVLIEDLELLLAFLGAEAASSGVAVLFLEEFHDVFLRNLLLLSLLDLNKFDLILDLVLFNLYGVPVLSAGKK